MYPQQKQSDYVGELVGCVYLDVTSFLEVYHSVDHQMLCRCYRAIFSTIATPRKNGYIAIFPPYLDRREHGYIVDFPPWQIGGNGYIVVFFPQFMK